MPNNVIFIPLEQYMQMQKEGKHHKPSLYTHT